MLRQIIHERLNNDWANVVEVLAELLSLLGDGLTNAANPYNVRPTGWGKISNSGMNHIEKENSIIGDLFTGMYKISNT